jgi:cobalt-zinc-cadmium efflux system outer membrane protein
MKTLACLLIAASTAAALPARTGAALTVDQAVEQALEHNLDLAAARFNISVAEARQITARLRPNPVMSAGADHLDLLGTGYNNINNGGPNEYSLRTDFVIERGRKREARIGLAASDRTLAELGVRDAARRLIFDVESAFVDVQAATAMLKLANDNLSRLNVIVEVNSSRVRAGDLAEVELNRSQVAAMQYHTAVRQAELQLMQAKTRLSVLLGRDGSSADFEAVGEVRRDDPKLNLDEVRELAKRNRPDLLYARAAQARGQADLRLQLAQGRMDITAGTEYRRQQAPSGTGNSLGLFFSVPLPVFNRNQGEIARAERELAQSGLQTQSLETRVDGEVASAWQQYTKSLSIVSDIELRMLSTSRDVLQATEYSYRRGEATLIEFLDAQRAFNDIMQSYNEARAAYAKGLYLIDAVTARPLSK